MKHFYLVVAGEVEPAECDTPFDGVDSALCYATCEAEALSLANDYSDGLISPDNVWYNGKAYAALSRR